MKDRLSKSDWLAAEECLAKAWFRLRAPATPPNEAGLFRMQQGQEIGSRARELYPKGIFVSGTGGKTAAEITQTLVADPAVETLFEAAFRSGPFVAKGDVLRRQGEAWHVLEVKSSFSDTSKIKSLIDDLAYTTMVLRQTGLQVVGASLVLLSRNYRFGDGPDRLFEIIDKTVEVNARVAEFEGVAEGVARALFDDTPPAPALVSACRECEFFSEKCLGSGLAHTIFEIPSLHHLKLKRLAADGIIDLALIPNDLKLNERQERAKYSALSGNTVVEPGLGAALQSIDWPCHYLDFETVATVLPLYEGNGCHRQVLTQFSIHHRDDIDAEPSHSEYLADATKDCEKELAEVLIEKLGDRGSIIVYSNFEATRIKALRDAFPELAGRLQAILDRLKNILPVIEDHVYQPNFRGSFSIKKVLPALVPDLTYAALDVADGDTAITRFARMARGEISGDKVGITRQQLLDYCKLDTFAMVSLHQALIQLAAARRTA
jgi:CRISPR/Cas system-associated exonuclease Cas4 (RecB family)